jgi:PKD repeat protein
MKENYCKKILILVLLVICFSRISAQYCIPNPTYGAIYDTYIDSVRLMDIRSQDSYTPKDTSYNDYTQGYLGQTILTRGTTYTMTIQSGPYTSNMHFVAWIDYNKDFDFTDANEKLGEVIPIPGNLKVTISFTVPSNVMISTTRLRVRCVWNISNPDPCTNYQYGETEDYTVSITEFQKVGTGITGIGAGYLNFFNMGGDNYYDLIMQDEYSSTVPVRFYTNDGTGKFTYLPNYLTGGLPDPDNSNMSYTLCDLNNDNALDILFTYRNNSEVPKTLYYQKTGNFLNLVSTGMADLKFGTSAAADFNNDGRQDIVICGRSADNIPHTYIYMNTPTGFVLVNDKLKGLYGQVVAADFDNDRDIDILISGQDKYGNTNTILYRNDNNWNFTDVFANLNKDGYRETIQFGDFNNDSRLDIVIGTKVYRNDGNNKFTEVAVESFDGFGLGDSGHLRDINNDGNLELISQDSWGVIILKYNGIDSFRIDQQLFTKGDNLDIADINGDRKQDIIVNSYPEAFLIKNVTLVTNNAPTAPTKFNTAIGDSGFYSVSLKWGGATDDKTSLKSLSYNLRVGTTSGGNDIVSSMTSTTNNSLLKPWMGNVYTNTSWYLKNLKPGKYYWSVQTVDNSGLASAFSAEQQFTILAPLTLSTFLVQGRINPAGAGADFDGDKDMDLVIKDSLLSIQEQISAFNYSYHKICRNCDILDIKDLNNDNLPDIIARHNKIPGVEQKDSLILLINKGNFVFSLLKIDTVSVFTVAAADFDNDGDIDILVHDRGYYLYECIDSLKYNRIKLPLTEQIYRASLFAIDIDRDNYMDFIIAGKEGNGTSGKCITNIYKNNRNNNFTLSQSIQPGIGSSTFMASGFAMVTNPADITFNDFNFDGYPDLLISGDDEYRNNTSQIFLNDGTGKLLLTNLSPRPSNKFSSSWIDFNTDGYLDIIMPKIGWTIDNIIYLNDRNTGYTGFANCVDSLITAMYIKAIDVDQDKDKDILCTYKIPVGVDGYRTETKIYTNNNNFVNQAPNPPASITHAIDSFTVILNWIKGWDKLTGNEGLTYNIWVGTANNKADIVSPMSDLVTGYRYVENIGNAGTNLSWTLKNLPLGKYYWSVQSIDNSYTGSTWAPVSTFELSALTANFSNDSVCLGQKTHLTDISVTTNPITLWRWDFGDGKTSNVQNPVFTFTKAGNNPVKLVVKSGVAIDSITKNVFVKAIPNSDFTSNVVCTGTPTDFTNTTNINGLTINEWHWDFGDGSGSNVQNPGTHGYLVPGSYNTVLVAVAGNGCSDTIRKPVVIGIIPTAAITSSGSPTFCSGDSIVLTNSFFNNYNYSWQIGNVDITGAVNNSYTARQTGSFTVRVTNPIGNCTSLSTPVNVLVNDKPLQPSISLNGNSQFCAGDSVLLTVTQNPNLNFHWKLNGGTIGSNSNQFVAKSTGTYNLIVSNSNGCSASSSNSINVVVNLLPSVSTVSLNGPTQFCQGGNITLSTAQTAGYTYTWSNEAGFIASATTNSYTATYSGKYQLQISNEQGCSVITPAVNVTVKPIPYKPVIASDNYQQGKCLGENPLRLNVNQIVTEYNYQWSRNGIPLSNAGTFSLEGFLAQGDYSVEADLNGCKVQSDLFSITYQDAPEKPMIYAQGPSVWYLACSNDSASKYRWYCNGNLIEGADKYFYVANRKMGNYQVSISNTKGCITMSDITTIPPGTTGLEETDPFDGLKIYPNPTPGLFTIEMDNQIFGELVIDILTQEGKKTLKIKFEKTYEHFLSQIDLSGQLKGLYLIYFRLKNYSEIKKIIIE